MIKSNTTWASLILALSLLPFGCGPNEPKKTKEIDMSGIKPLAATIETTKGPIHLTIFADQTPITAANSVNLSRRGYYDGVKFHRVIKNFMIQGGGLTPDMKHKLAEMPIKNEADNGLKNDRGTVAMARTRDPHSATNQFFINTKNSIR